MFSIHIVPLYIALNFVVNYFLQIVPFLMSSIFLVSLPLCFIFKLTDLSENPSVFVLVKMEKKNLNLEFSLFSGC